VHSVLKDKWLLTRPKRAVTNTLRQNPLWYVLERWNLSRAHSHDFFKSISWQVNL